MSTPDLGMFLLAHRALRRDADAVAAAARRLDAQSVAEAAALLEAFDVTEAMLRHHHVAEDTLVWPAIAAADPTVAPQLEELEAEHAIVERWLAEVRLALMLLGDARSVDRAAVAVDLVVATTALAAALDQHLAHEERVAVPLIQTRLTAEQWEAIDGRRKAGMSPEESATALAWILSALPDEQREAVASSRLPSEVVTLWRTTWAPAYSERVAALAA